MVCISGTQVCERLRQEVHHKAKASLSYLVRPVSKRSRHGRKLVYFRRCPDERSRLKPSGKTFLSTELSMGRPLAKFCLYCYASLRCGEDEDE